MKELHSKLLSSFSFSVNETGCTQTFPLTPASQTVFQRNYILFFYSIFYELFVLGHGFVKQWFGKTVDLYSLPCLWVFHGAISIPPASYLPVCSWHHQDKQAHRETLRRVAGTNSISGITQCTIHTFVILPIWSNQFCFYFPVQNKMVYYSKHSQVFLSAFQSIPSEANMYRGSWWATWHILTFYCYFVMICHSEPATVPWLLKWSV